MKTLTEQKVKELHESGNLGIKDGFYVDLREHTDGIAIDKISTHQLPNTDAINPKYYRKYTLQTIEMMQHIFGNEETAQYCEMNAFKYRMRMGHKNGNSIEQDMQKEEWYLDRAKQLRGE